MFIKIYFLFITACIEFYGQYGVTTLKKSFNCNQVCGKEYMKEFNDLCPSYALTYEGCSFSRINRSGPPEGIYCLNPALHDEDVYVMLQSMKLSDGTFIYEMHIWVGANASGGDVTLAERYAASLDVKARRRTTLHWERQHYECDQFLSYFLTVRYLSGKYEFQYRSELLSAPVPPPRLFSLYLHRNKRIAKEVKCEMSSLNKRDPLILVSGVVYVLPRGNWNPDLLETIGREFFYDYAAIYSIEDYNMKHLKMLDKTAATEDWDDFYKILGWDDLYSFPSIPDGVDVQVDKEGQDASQLYEILRNRRGRIYYKKMQFPLPKWVLNSKSLYILTNGKDDICLWIGKKNQDRNKAKLYGLAKIQEFTFRQMPHSKWSPWGHMSIVPEGLEPLSFKLHFYNWIEPSA